MCARVIHSNWIDFYFFFLYFWSGRSNFSSLFDLIKHLFFLFCHHHFFPYLFHVSTIEISKIMHGYCLRSHIKLNRFFVVVVVVAVNKINRYFVNKSWSMEWKEWTQLFDWSQITSRKKRKASMLFWSAAYTIIWCRHLFKFCYFSLCMNSNLSKKDSHIKMKSVSICREFSYISDTMGKCKIFVTRLMIICQ